MQEYKKQIRLTMHTRQHISTHQLSVHNISETLLMNKKDTKVVKRDCQRLNTYVYASGFKKCVFKLPPPWLYMFLHDITYTVLNYKFNTVSSRI